jgi:DNA helicase-2/ATP-dependent DNA helicase PcrA
MPRLEPERLLDDLDPEQREAVVATSGPVAILCGRRDRQDAGDRRRTAYAIETDVVPPDQVLVVTFTDKAAGGVVERLRSLGLPGVTGQNLSRARHEPAAPLLASRHDGAPLPQLLDSRSRSSAGSGASCRAISGSRRPGPRRRGSSGRSRRIGPREYEREVARVAPGREPPIPVDLFVRTFDNYDARRLARAHRLRRPPRRRSACSRTTPTPRTIRARKRWFSVDEYQDTSPLQRRLLELWLGERQDVCVVGDVDQTIYSFTGVVRLPDHVRGSSTPAPGSST